MSGRRTWMPDEAAQGETTEGEERGQQPAPDNGHDRHEDEQTNARKASEPQAPASGEEANQSLNQRWSRGWMPGDTGKAPEQEAQGSPDEDPTEDPNEDTAVMDAPAVKETTDQASDRTVSRKGNSEESGAPAQGGAGLQAAASHRTPASADSDADTTDIPLTPGARREESGQGSLEDTGQSAGKAGVLSAFKNRITGRGSLSAEREKQEEKEKAEREAVEPGGSMDPNERMQRLSSSIRSGDHEPSTAAEEDEEDEREGLAGNGPLLWLIDHWIPITVPLALLCVGLFVFATMFTSGSSGEEIASSKGGSGGGDPREASGGGGGQSNEEQVPLYDSGLAFEYTQEDGKAELTAGDLSWTGEVEGGGDGDPKETITLAGPTAAKINRGYRMEGDSKEPGEVATMTFAVEAADAPDIHATYQRFSGASSDGPVEAPSGSYSITEDSGNLIAEGTYSDRRTGGGEDGNEVIRTYTEHIPGQDEPDQFRVLYEVPPQTPIPALVGWQEPGDRAAGEDGQG